MHDIEYQTVLYTRELLVTPAWKDPQFTAFLTLWNYEEYWHGHALGRVLAMHDQPAHDPRLDRDAQVQQALPVLEPGDLLGCSATVCASSPRCT